MPETIPATMLASCDDALPLATTKNCVRFSQFLLLRKGDTRVKPQYLTLPSASGPVVTPEQVTKVVEDIRRRVQQALERSSSELVTFGRRPPQKSDRVSPVLLPAGISLRLPSTAQGLDKFAQQLTQGLQRKLAIERFAHWGKRRVFLGVCAVYEQCWDLQGYSRGELVSSISLAPGEQVVLEQHTWDKTTFKSEEELTEELQLTNSSKLTQRDSQDVVSTLASQAGSKLNGNLSLQIPIPLGEVILPLGVGGGGEVASQVNSQFTTALQSATERTEEAATTLKNQRRVRIEVSRDTGREDKQTRTIANTNRCHSLNCHYFEIVANYTIRTRLETVTPCLLVPLPRLAVTREFVLCHEHALRKVLIDPVFAQGFAAAKLLETAEALARIEAQRPSPTPGEAGGGGAAPTAGDVSGLRQDILDAWEELNNALDTLESVADAIARFDVVEVITASGDLIAALPKVLYVALLAANQDAFSAIKALDRGSADVPAAEALRRFFSVVTHRDFQYVPLKSEVAEGLDALGIPEDVVDALLALGSLSPIIGITTILELIADDAGLHAAVKAAEERVGQPELPSAAPRAAGEALAAGGLLNLRFPRGQAASLSAISDLQRAEARVEFERLRCHLLDYASHYKQAIWALSHPDDRAAHIANLGLGGLTSGELLGFAGDRAAYGLTDLRLLKDVLSDKELKELLLELRSRTETASFQLPTGGTILEAYIGECDACEDFIKQNRDIELRSASARADQEEAEAERRKQRLATAPPLLDEFVSPPSGNITVKVDGTGNGE